jgi:hypothetical protein
MKMIKLAACSLALVSVTLLGCATNQGTGTVMGAGVGHWQAMLLHPAAR